jgi:hypothetical protein
MNLSMKSTNEKAKTKNAVSQGVYVPGQISNPHKLTYNTQLTFEKIINEVNDAKRSASLPRNYLSIIQSMHRGRIVCRNKDCFHVTVSESLVNRALQILDGLVKELEKRKFKIRSNQDETGYFVVAIKDNESISFRLFEGYKYHPLQKYISSMSELEKLLYRDKQPIATGKLTLSALALKTNIEKNWTDGKRLIEEDLHAISHEFDGILFRQKQRLKEDAIRDEKRREELIIFRETESRKHAEKTVYDKAMQEAQSFIAYRDLETYLNYLEDKYLKEYGSLSLSAISWLSTARKIAQVQNPVSNRLKLLSHL